MTSIDIADVLGIYRHALPPGYILKKDRKRLEEMKKLETISLEELIESERAKLDPNKFTKVTLESFIAWKKRKIVEKRKKAAEEEKQKKANVKSGKQVCISFLIIWFCNFWHFYYQKITWFLSFDE